MGQLQAGVPQKLVASTFSNRSPVILQDFLPSAYRNISPAMPQELLPSTESKNTYSRKPEGVLERQEIHYRDVFLGESSFKLNFRVRGEFFTCTIPPCRNIQEPFWYLFLMLPNRVALLLSTLSGNVRNVGG